MINYLPVDFTTCLFQNFTNSSFVLISVWPETTWKQIKNQSRRKILKVNQINLDENDHNLINISFLSCVVSHIKCCAFCYFYRRRFDFQSPSRMDRNVELFLNIEKALKEVKLVTFNCIILCVFLVTFSFFISIFKDIRIFVIL